MKTRVLLEWAGRAALPALILLAGDAALRYAHATPQAAPAAPKIITAQEFRLVDKAGKPRAAFAVREDGSPGLTLLDASGKLRASFRLRPDGSSALSLHDADGKNRAALDTQANGSASLTLNAREGKSGVGLVIVPDHDPAVIVSDKDGKVVWSAPEGP